MKKLCLFVISLLLTTSCAQSSQESVGEEYECYLYEKNESHDDTLVNIGFGPNAYQSNGYYSFSISLNVTNQQTTTRTYKIANLDLIRENDSTHYDISTKNSSIEVFGENTASIDFNGKISSDLATYNYSFTVSIDLVKYTFKLYERPDELRETLAVSYQIDGLVVHSEQVKKGRKVGVNYVFESDDHLRYCSSWKIGDDTFSAATTINENVTVKGSLSENLHIWGMHGDDYYSFDRINRVHSDGKLVLPSLYDEKPYFIANYVIHNNEKIKEIYIPTTIIKIYLGNFDGCPSLETIYFAGTQEEWNSIQNLSTIPSSVRIVYSTSFHF